MKLKLFVIMIFLQASRAFGSVQGQACDTAALEAARTHGVPLQVMLAITRVETGRDYNGELQPWPWAVNSAGQSHWFDSHDEAVAFVQNTVAAGQANIDIGCFQLNMHWHGEAFASIDAMFDPDQNADYAARFLVHNHAQTGNWVDAVARYHSATPVHAAAYVERVEKVLALLEDAGARHVAGVGAFGGNDDLPDPPNQYPLLQPGVQAGLASLVPIGVGLQPLFMATP